jgi:hydrogenase maturation protease
MSNEPAVPIVVIGVGNPIMGDDGFGLVALDRLRSGIEGGSDIEFLDGGTWGMNLLPTIERADRLLILDAINHRAEPGTIVELEGAEVPRYLDLQLSTHQIDLSAVLALADLRGSLPGELVALGVQPERIELMLGLSPTVLAALDAVVARARARLEAWRLCLLPGALRA